MSHGIHSLSDGLSIKPFEKTTIRNGEIVRFTGYKDKRGREYERIEGEYVPKELAEFYRKRSKSLGAQIMSALQGSAAPLPRSEPRTVYVAQAPGIDPDWIDLLVVYLMMYFAVLIVGMLIVQAWRSVRRADSPSRTPTPLSSKTQTPASEVEVRL
jgi:hypothetical protein